VLVLCVHVLYSPETSCEQKGTKAPRRRRRMTASLPSGSFATTAKPNNITPKVKRARPTRQPPEPTTWHYCCCCVVNIPAQPSGPDGDETPSAFPLAVSTSEPGGLPALLSLCCCTPSSSSSSSPSPSPSHPSAASASRSRSLRYPPAPPSQPTPARRLFPVYCCCAPPSASPHSQALPSFSDARPPRRYPDAPN
jgi:hypothetical protein